MAYTERPILIGQTIDGVAYSCYSGGLINRFLQLIGKIPLKTRYYTITDLNKKLIETI